MRNKSICALLLSAAIAATVLVGGHASAQADSHDQTQDQVSKPDGDHVVVETYDENGNVVSIEVHFSDDDNYMASGGGEGGTPSDSGCRKVTVRNEKETTFGFTAYWFNTWTYWCWNRENRTISDVETDWYLDDVDDFQEWQGILVDNTHYFNWYYGYPTSGYYHEKQGHFKNCIPHIGCTANSYPRNQLWSHSDGTWSWKTSD